MVAVGHHGQEGKPADIRSVQFQFKICLFYVGKLNKQNLRQVLLHSFEGYN